MTSRRLNISSGAPYEPIYGYSRAVRYGDQIHVSGTCAPKGHENSDSYTQMMAAFDIIGRALREAGSSFEDVVRTVVYVTDIADFEEIARAHGEVFKDIRPASTTVQVTSFLRPWQRIEIETYAIAGAHKAEA
ncbi:enamine deaminase RidA (YjgF/YER057c/UK114 family) [Microvirga flocculans]|uniref:Enamine deaminase RidA (YjgF/YER057c/UK114 family) n=1 Tax=Microvirga flocculans TaxID=217168 RepID=A0A7W6N6H8_9HYPH|nr:RidA family protein [Microvirga flocculans]MBB4038445.1 enamine deaminase RidA (YjgF/YER057c/UK114 family) [Microvirga flocculans]